MYDNSFTRRNPGFLVIMIDQSGSMCATSQNNGIELAEIASNSVNNLITGHICRLCGVDVNGNEFIHRRVKICLIGYGGPNNEAYCILKDSEHPDGCMWIDEIDEKFPMGKVKVATREGLFAQDCIEVVKPVVDCCTPMGWAMSLAKDKVVDWVNSHNSAADPVPVVINISDGCPTDSEDDVRRYANEIKSLQIPDGNPRIFNIHISDDSASDVRFPSNTSGLESWAHLLFEISSEVTSDLLQSIPELVNSHVSGGEKMMMSNVSDPVALLNFLKIGTLQKLR